MLQDVIFQIRHRLSEDDSAGSGCRGQTGGGAVGGGKYTESAGTAGDREREEAPETGAAGSMEPGGVKMAAGMDAVRNNGKRNYRGVKK